MTSYFTSAAGGGGGRTCGLNLDIIKSPAAAAAATTYTTSTTTTIRRSNSHNNYSSPSSSSSTILVSSETDSNNSSTISSSSRSSPSLISNSSTIRKPRTPRKRPNQIYNEAAALLSTAYPNIFSSKHLNSSSFSTSAKFVKPQSEYYSSCFEDSSAQLLLPLPFPFFNNKSNSLISTSSQQEAVSNHSNSDSALSDSNSNISQDEPSKPNNNKFSPLSSSGNKFLHNSNNNWSTFKDEEEDFDIRLDDDEFDAESILDEENIEESRGIDSIIGCSPTSPPPTVSNDISTPSSHSQQQQLLQQQRHNINNSHGTDTNNRVEFCCFGYPYPMQMPLPLPVGLGFQVGGGGGGYGMSTLTRGVNAFRTGTIDSQNWWQFQSVDVGQISPRLHDSLSVVAVSTTTSMLPPPSNVSSDLIKSQADPVKKQQSKKNSSSSKKKKKKMEHIIESSTPVLQGSGSRIESKCSPTSVAETVPSSNNNSGNNEGDSDSKSISIPEPHKVMLQLNFDNVLDAWSDRPSPFSDDFVVTDTSSDNGGLLARLAQIDLFGENGGIREASVQRYKEKRRNRLFSKKIRYQVRKVNADQRPRSKGRFVRSPNSGDDSPN